MTEIHCVAEVGNNLGEGLIWHEIEQALHWVDACGRHIRRCTSRRGALDS